MAGETQERMRVEASGQGPAPMKLSRYRSVRRAGSHSVDVPKAATPAVPVPSVPSDRIPQNSTESAKQQGPSIARSMSRYRRQKNTGPTTTSQPPLPVPINHDYAPGTQQSGNLQGVRSDGKARDVKEEVTVSGTAGVDRSKDRSGGYEDERGAARTRNRQDAMSRLIGEDKIVTPEPRTKKSTGSHKHTEIQNKDASCNAKDGATKQGGEGDPNKQLSGNENKLRSLKGTIKRSRSKKEPPKDPALPKPIETSGGVFPGIDAPVFAANAGERRVRVQYRKKSVHLSVTALTRVQDLLNSAQDSFEGEVDAEKFTVIESFAQLALERPLRKYENVRDVMNSWTHDEENVLIIIPPASLDALYQLEVQSAPTQQPADMTFHIYHSQRPRKWDKRYVTLRADGQVTVAKKQQAQDQANICHASDFDVYSPTSSSLSNDVKPPKRICFAVKSQQKASMFLSTENYVHFFCTNDNAIADGFYKAIRAWRSWYLANVLGAGQREDVEQSMTGISWQLSDEFARLKPYQLENRKPLLDFNAHDQQQNDAEVHPAPALEGQISDKTRQLFLQKKTGRDHAPPPSAYPKSLTVDTSVGSTMQGTDESPFSSSGLLGQTYILRQRNMQEREENEKIFEEAFNHQGLVNAAGSGARRTSPRSQPSSRSNTMTAADKSDVSAFVKRSQSVGKGKHRPLVDLTPVYQEPPQHVRKGRGVNVEPGTPLVDSATSPGLASGAIVIPPATTWKRPLVPDPTLSSSNDKNGRIRSRPNTVRCARHRRPSCTVPASPTENVASPDGQFIPNTLLARSANPGAVQSGQTVGHGLVTGDRNATKPMLDLSPENPFVQGSLLREL